jgi:hypothetical protein
MPVISLAEVAANRRTIEVDLGLPPAEDGTAQTLTVTYRVNTMTPADELMFQTAATSTDAPGVQQTEFLGFAVRMLISWGLTGPLTARDGTVIVAPGKPVPITTDAMRALSSTVLNNVLKACMTDINDPKALTSTGAR